MRKALVLLAFLAGCASVEPKERPLGPGEVRSASAARDAVASGRTKAEVRAALGSGAEIAFDSGYEVWVYREQLKPDAKPPRTELVVLFSPTGLVTKARIR